MKKNSRMDPYIMHASVSDPYAIDKWKAFQRVQIDVGMNWVFIKLKQWLLKL